MILLAIYMPCSQRNQNRLVNAIAGDINAESFFIAPQFANLMEVLSFLVILRYRFLFREGDGN